MEKWLLKTAWPMTAPKPYSLFHIIFALAGFGAAALLALLLKNLSYKKRINFLFSMGILLTAAELYKQFFLYYVVNGGRYDWWYFPFQLCSIPMYLCLLLPLFREKGQAVLCTFMCSYNLLGALMTFIEPSGLMHPYWTLTMHSFLWHIILILIGLTIAFSGMAPHGYKDFLKATGMFLSACLIATAINILARPFGNPDMFYITPYYPTTQMIYREISAALGIIPGIIIYIASIILGAFLIQVFYNHLSVKRANDTSHTL